MVLQTAPVRILVGPRLALSQAHDFTSHSTEQYGVHRYVCTEYVYLGTEQQQLEI